MATLNRTAVFYLVASLVLAMGVVAASVLVTDAPVAAAGTVIPPDRVVARLQTGATAYPADLAADMTAQRAAPADLPLALRTAQGMIAFGRAQGDSRLVGAAVGVLRPFLDDDNNPQALYLAATARQYQHDFPGAIALLDRAITADPRDVNSLLSRATIRIVRGDFTPARADCQRINDLGQAAVGFLCMTTSHTLTEQGPALRQRLDQILSTAGLLDPGFRPWALGLMGEIALHQGDLPAAKGYLEAVLQLDPLALRERLMLADLALEAGDGPAVTALLADSPDTDGVLIRRVLAEPDAAGAADLRAVLAARFALNLDLGLTAHAREEALYFATIAPDPAQALARAQVNWALQHEYEDAVLLTGAAELAGQPETAKPVTDWMAAEGIIPRQTVAAP